MTKWLNEGEDAGACHITRALCGIVIRGDYKDELRFDSSTTKPGELNGAYWIGDTNSLLSLPIIAAEGRTNAYMEIPRERVWSVERWQEQRETAHEWGEPQPDTGNRRYLDYATPEKYASGYFVWCEGCDTARMATREEIEAAGLTAVPEGPALGDYQGMRADGATR